MDEKRKRELSYLFLKYLTKQRGIHFTPDMKREIGNVAKEVGVSFDEAWLFAKTITYEIMEETFGKK